MTRTSQRAVAAGVAVVAIGIAAAVIATSSSPVDGDELSVRTCELAALASEDPATAGDRFMSEIHGPLHEVAAELTESDRPAAGRLLVAKNAVERAVDGDASEEGELAARLTTLAQRLPDAISCEDD